MAQPTSFGQMEARSRDKSPPFLKQCMEGRLTSPSLSQPFEKGHWSALTGMVSTMPTAHCTFTQNISKLPNANKMPFSVALSVRNRSALARLQAPSGYQILNIKIMLTYGPWQGLHAQERWPRTACENRLETMLSFFCIFNCSRRVCILNSRAKLLN